ncbi:MAG: DUF58 domain-containing protein [Armatimonadetes bacterium]|nr:DUF58 domain-containing protein [Armatimonadota bacterium]
MLAPNELRSLEKLRLAPRKSFAGKIRGERLTKTKGISIEFADYREYTDGDDLRHLDWNVLARLDTPVLRTYQDEEDLAVYLLVDASASMAFGEPTKLASAMKLACAIGYVALLGGDIVYPLVLGSREPTIPALRGRAGFPKLVGWASKERDLEKGKESLSGALRDFTQSRARPGLVVLISDGLDPGITASLRAVAARGHEVLMLQVLSAPELDPDLEGDLKLIDSENGGVAEVTANGATLLAYRKRLAEHNAGISDGLRRAGGRYALTQTGEKLEQIIRDVFKREGWMR